MIELQKYSKIDVDPFKLTLTRHSDNRNKLINYTAGGLLAGIVLISLNICYTNVPVEEFNMRLFENEVNSEAMKAYINFLAEYKKTYPDT